MEGKGAVVRLGGSDHAEEREHKKQRCEQRLADCHRLRTNGRICHELRLSFFACRVEGNTGTASAI
jgi:hypothetical protein